VGVPVTFSVSPLDVWSPLGATTWSFGDGATGAGMSPTHTYARSGTFAVGLSSSDALGNASSASRTIAIAPAPRPRLSRLRLSPAVFRAARSGPSVKAAGARVGTRVGYSLDIASSVRFTVERARGGRRVGGRCVRPTRRNRTRTRCTRYVTVRGSFKRGRRAGADRFRFTGRLAGGALAPGRYRLVATPTANSKVGRPGRASFRIVR
jgi:hypothetical protein